MNNRKHKKQTWYVGNGYAYVYVPIECIDKKDPLLKKKLIRYFDKTGTCIAVQYRVRTE